MQTVWKGLCSFGMVSFPIKLTSAARGETVSFNLLHQKDNSRINQVVFCQAENQPIPRNELVKGYEYEKGRYVVITDADIDGAAPKSSKVMEILEFVPFRDVDPIYFESSYYIHPDSGGEKPYGLLLQTLKAEGLYGVAKLAMRNREHTVIIRPGRTGLLLHTMFYQDEVRATDEFRTDLGLVKDKELAMARMLVSTMTESFEPEKYKDTYRENILKVIEAKKNGVAAEPQKEEPTASPIFDIMEALKQSLENADKRKKSKKKVA